MSTTAALGGQHASGILYLIFPNLWLILLQQVSISFRNRPAPFARRTFEPSLMCSYHPWTELQLMPVVGEGMGGAFLNALDSSGCGLLSELHCVSRAW